MSTVLKCGQTAHMSSCCNLANVLDKSKDCSLAKRGVDILVLDYPKNNREEII